MDRTRPTDRGRSDVCEHAVVVVCLTAGLTPVSSPTYALAARRLPCYTVWRDSIAVTTFLRTGKPVAGDLGL
jgi:hypothetical protein